jgi:hypothetical protein
MANIYKNAFYDPNTTAAVTVYGDDICGTLKWVDLT